MHKIIHGNKLNVKVREGERIGLAKSCTLEFRLNLREIRNPSAGGWKSYIPQTVEWTISCSGLFSAYSYADLTSMISRQELEVEFVDEDSGVHYIGNAFMESLQVTGAVKELSTYSMKFKGSGPIEEY